MDNKHALNTTGLSQNSNESTREYYKEHFLSQMLFNNYTFGITLPLKRQTNHNIC